MEDYIDEDILIEDIEIPEELSYSFTSHEIHKQIMNGWKQLKKAFSKDADYYQQVIEFDKLLKYFFE